MEAELRLVLGEPERAWSVLAELETDGDAPDLAIGIAALELASGHPEAAVESVNAFLDGDRPSVLPFTTIEARVDRGRGTRLPERSRRAPFARSNERWIWPSRAATPTPSSTSGAPLKSLLRRRIRQGTGHRAFAGELLTTLEEGQRDDRPEARSCSSR